MHVTKNVVNEDQHIALLFVAEVFGDCHACQGHAQAGTGRLVHLAEHHRGLVNNAALVKVAQQVVTLAAALAHAAEDGVALALLGHVVDQLGQRHRLAGACAAEQPHLATLGEGSDQVNNLDASLEHPRFGGNILVGRRGAVDVVLLLVANRAALVNHIAQHIEDPTQGARADRHRNRSAGIKCAHAAAQTIGGTHRHAAYPIVAQVLLHFGDHAHLVIRRTAASLGGGGFNIAGLTNCNRILRREAAAGGSFTQRGDGLGVERDFDGVVDLRQLVGRERDVNYRTHNLDDFTFSSHSFSCFGRGVLSPSYFTERYSPS